MRLGHVTLLTPWREGYTPIPERSAGREKTLNAAPVEQIDCG